MDWSEFSEFDVKKQIVNLIKRALSSPSFWVWFGMNEATICPIKCWKCSEVKMLRIHIIRHVKAPAPKYSARFNCDGCKKELYRDGSEGYLSVDGAKKHGLEAFIKIYEFKVKAMNDDEARVYLSILQSKVK